MSKQIKVAVLSEETIIEIIDLLDKVDDIEAPEGQLDAAITAHKRRCEAMIEKLSPGKFLTAEHIVKEVVT